MVDYIQSQISNYFIQAKSSSPYLMLVLHGRGDSMRPFRGLPEELRLFDFNYLLLNAPRRYANGFSWYGEPPYKKHGVLRIRSQMFELLGGLEKLGWMSHNIYLLGHSQGALVASDIALYYPKKLGGIIGISGYFHFFPRWRKNMASSAKSTPWLFTHGRHDTILNIEETHFGVRQLQKIGLEIDWLELEKEHDFESSEMPIIKKWINEHRR